MSSFEAQIEKSRKEVAEAQNRRIIRQNRNRAHQDGAGHRYHT